MIYLRKAKEIDIEKLYISLNKKYVEKNKKNVSKLENRYKEWYKNLIESDKFILLIIENENNDFIGHIKYEMKSEEVEVLIFILEKYRNNGIGKKALEESFMYIDKNKKIVAKILEENIDSPTMKHYLSGKFSDKELDQARLMIKMFKSKKIKLHLKE